MNEFSLSAVGSHPCGCRPKCQAATSTRVDLTIDGMIIIHNEGRLRHG